MPVGLLVPLRYDDTLPADQFKIQLHALMKSYPTLAPVMGAFKLQIDFFYCPWRNYMPEWMYNDRQADLQSVELPYFDDVPLEDRHPVAANSLWDYFGYPVGYWYNTSTSGASQRFSALPFLMYYDIFRNYYANQQEDDFYMFGRGDEDYVPNSAPLTWIDDMMAAVRSGDKDFTRYFGNEYIRPSAGQLYDTVRRDIPYGGLICRTYMPDQFTTLLNSQKIETIKQKTFITVGPNPSGAAGAGITMDQIVTARKGYRFLNNTAIADGRYGEQIRAHFGVRTDDKLNIPQFLGSTSLRMTFDDVVSTSNNNTGDPDATTGLGSRGGQGTVFGRNGNQYVNCTDYGTIMCIASIIPIVDYYQGISKFNIKTKMTDVFFPEFDGLGYQDVMRSELCALPYYDTSVPGASLGSNSDFATAVGKQPAWLEYMTKDNRIHGEFTQTLRYWTISRDYARYAPTSSTSGVNGRNFNPTSYIFPQDYNYMFVDESIYDNFQLQVAFDVLAKRPISKQLTPTL